jgi:hypothetical protein
MIMSTCPTESGASSGDHAQCPVGAWLHPLRPRVTVNLGTQAPDAYKIATVRKVARHAIG